MTVTVGSSPFIRETQGTAGKLGNTLPSLTRTRSKVKYLPLSPTLNMFAKRLSDFPEFFLPCGPLPVIFCFVLF